MAPYLKNALELLGAAFVLPILGGIIGRAFVFRRDLDDVARHPEHAHLAEKFVSHEPEPKPAVQEAWPSFAAQQSLSTAAESSIPVSEPSLDFAPPVRWGYRGTGLEVAKVKEAVEAVWRKFTAEPKRRPGWARYDQWSGGSPYALAGAAGSFPGSTTLTVEVPGGPTASPEELREIWESEILPELRRQFGTQPFGALD